MKKCTHGEWNEENQQKLFARFMKENLKDIEIIYLKDELIGFYNGKEIVRLRRNLMDNEITNFKENIPTKAETKN